MPNHCLESLVAKHYFNVVKNGLTDYYVDHFINYSVGLFDTWEKEIKDYVIDYNSLYFESEIAEGLLVCCNFGLQSANYK